ncbi:Ger(x)C family spore germination protein [Heyndrickxia ginsengihumi]|uniref:Ger(x)C family spore germination protein n=1 Tax=Heyndrickxia ginsengihumi TaxID=363870 RepID=UPI000471A5E1|nr:Ger(x)C family spore germination protein [Heyndrickxia ginsengihumi]
MKIRPFILSIMMICMLSILSGCWGQNELSNLALVNAMGIDRTKDGQILITFQIINAQNIASVQGGGAAQGPTVTIYQSKGGNLLEANRQATNKITRIMYYSHANLLVIGEELAKEGIYPLLDAFERDKEFRNTTTVIIARNGRASNFLKVLTPIDKIPTDKVNKTLNTAQELSGGKLKSAVSGIIEDATTPGIEPTIGSFEMIGNMKKGESQDSLNYTDVPAHLVSSDLGLFKHGKLIDWVGGYRARAITWILKKTEGTTVPLKWKGSPYALDYKVKESEPNISVTLKNGKPHVNVTLKVIGNIEEATRPISLKDPKQLSQLQMMINRKLENQLEDTVHYVQGKKTDVFGFGELIYRKYPGVWKTMSKNWDDEGFPNLSVSVHVQSIVSHSEMRSDPFISDIKE